MRLLIADKLHPRAVEELRALPVQVEYEPEITKETLEAKLPGVGILVVRSTEVTAQALEKSRELNLIVRAGAEFSTIDARAAAKRGRGRVAPSGQMGAGGVRQGRRHLREDARRRRARRDRSRGRRAGEGV